MSGSFVDLNLSDKYNEALKEIIQAKVEGKEIVTYEEAERPVVDIMTALKQSIEEAKARRQPMVKATGKAKPAETKPAAPKAKEQKRKRA